MRILLKPIIHASLLNILFIAVYGGVLFYLLYAIVLPKNAQWLLHPMDGIYAYTHARNQSLFFGGNLMNYGWSPIQGLGFIWHGFLGWLHPEMWSAFIADGALHSPRFVLSVIALELCGGLYFLARSAHLSKGTALLGGMLTLALMLPIIKDPMVYLILNLSPQIAGRIFVSFLLIGMLMRIKETRHLLSWGWGVVVCAITLVVMAPLPFILIIPAMSILSIFILCASGSRKELMLKLSPGIVFLVLCLLGPLYFFYGIYSYTPVQFIAELTTPTALSYKDGSILFQYWRSMWHPTLYVFGMVGALWSAVVAANKIQRMFSLGLLAVGIISVLASYISSFFVWSKPFPPLQFVYFEFLVFPLYALFAAFLMIRVACFTCRFVPIPKVRKKHTAMILLVTMLVGGHIYELVAPSYYPHTYRVPWPPTKTDLVTYLEENIAIAPNQPFRGRAAGISGAGHGNEYIWFDQTNLDFYIHQKTGNDHRTIGLWHYNIPTLEAYSSSYSPVLYHIASHLLVHEGQKLARLMLSISKAHIPLMRAMGIRYVVSDTPVPNTTKHAVSQHIPAGTHAREIPEGELNLYEIDGVNTQGWSPTTPILLSFQDFLASLEHNAMDLRTSFVADISLETTLSAAENMGIVLQPNGMHVQATSEGWSVMLLPFEYSRCFTLEQHNTSSKARLFRANYFQMAILFHQHLNAKLAFEFGPFLNADCLLKDVKDAESFLYNR